MRNEDLELHARLTVGVIFVKKESKRLRYNTNKLLVRYVPGLQATTPAQRSLVYPVHSYVRSDPTAPCTIPQSSLHADQSMKFLKALELLTELLEVVAGAVASIVRRAVERTVSPVVVLIADGVEEVQLRGVEEERDCYRVHGRVAPAL